MVYVNDLIVQFKKYIFLNSKLYCGRKHCVVNLFYNVICTYKYITGLSTDFGTHLEINSFVYKR